jgi:DNA mismatch repair protein MutS
MQNDAQSLQNDLFSQPMHDEPFEPPDHVAQTHPIEIALRELDPDSLSPKEALDALYELKKRLS